MRGSRHVAAACALGAALLVPAIPLVAQEADGPAADAPRPTLTPSNVRPDAALASNQADGKVAFDASGSADSDGSIVLYEWDLDGDSVYETKTAAEPRVEHAYDPGTTLIAGVRVTDDAGASDDATAAVVVAAAAEPAGADADPAAPSASQTPAASGAALVPTGELGNEEPAAPRAVRSSRESADDDEEADDEAAEPRVVAAANGAVTITDFEFSPATVNVNVGDSVTWLNRGPTVHTATADDGSFDSGNLTRGKSYSRKFTKAGTVSYLCTPHPFMKGKVVVGGTGASGSGGGSGSGSGGESSGDDGAGDTAGAGTDSGSGSSGDLAKTGVDLIAWSLFGFSVLLFGAALRYRLTE